MIEKSDEAVYITKTDLELLDELITEYNMTQEQAMKVMEDIFNDRVTRNA